MRSRIDLPMPKLGDTVTEGTVIMWLVAVGDVVTEGQALAEITTDKVTTDYPSPCSGTVVALLLGVDDTVPVGTPMVRIDTDDVLDEVVTKPSPVPTAPPEGLRATGAARAAASAAGIDVTAVAGRGRYGRVLEADVIAAAAPRQRVDPMRRAMTRHMEESWRRAAHAVVHTLIDVEDLERVRALRRLTALPFWVHSLAKIVGPPGDIGVAVARADGSLVVPVIAAAGASLEDCAARLDQAVQQARAGTLGFSTSPGQATVTNIGVFGGRFSQPILTAGQPIILGLGSVERRLVPHERGVSVRALQPVSMAYDRNRMDEVSASRMLHDLRVQFAAGG
jgi:pyruvate/2-oxoglutarate dehydrogenase complex dihydrolipoamide acyltransferase (E2) component